MTMRTAVLALLAFCLGLSACSAVGRVNPFGGSDDDADAPDRDRRVSFLTFEENLEVDPARAALGVTLPPAIRTSVWPNEGGFPDHAPQHLAASEDLRRVWRRNVGSGSSRRSRLSAPPIVAEGKVFIVDADNDVVAYDAQNGRRVWRSRLRAEDRRDREFRSGGVGYADGRVFVSIGFGAVAAFEASTGRQLWSTATSGPMHSPPTAVDGRVFAVSFDNELYALDAQTGEVIWSYQGLSEPARILTASSPAVQGDVVVAPFASGEIVAIDVRSSRLLWSDSLTRSGRTTALSALNDIAGSPVIFDGMVFAVSQSGIIAAFDLRTGLRLWDQPAGGIHMPWVVGEYLYIMTTDGKLAALSRRDGVTIWIAELPQYKRPERRRGRISWAGPVLAGGRLLLVSSEGEMLSLSATTGEQLDRYRVGGDVFIPPVVADETVYVLTDDANLVAYR
jgi:outer membrane protein assembly factor BamB